MAFVLTQFEAQLQKINPSISRMKDSSVEPLLVVLRTLPPIGIPSAAKKHDIQVAYANIPYDKQQKYKPAFDYLKKEIGALVDGLPVKPVMKIVHFGTALGKYQGKNAAGLTKSIQMPLRSYHHLTRLEYVSSNGFKKSMQPVGTRESIKFRSDPAGTPFNYTQAGTPRQFTQGATVAMGADYGSCDDEHSTVLPSIICLFPRVAGSLIAEQWYEYSTDAITWYQIPGAAFLLEKVVKQGGPTGWIYQMKKTNWAPHNTKPFLMDVEYQVDPPPEYMPVPGGKIDKSTSSPADIKQFAYKVNSFKIG